MEITGERDEADEEIRAAFELSLDLICVVDFDTATFTKVNPSFTRVLGYSEEELLGHEFLEFIHPDDLQPTIDLLENTLKKGIGVPYFENRYRTKTGQYRWLCWTGYPRFPTGLSYAIAHDITDRKQAEEALRVSNEHFRRLSEAAFEAILVHENGTLITANDQFFDMVGRTRSELEGKSLIQELVAPEAIGFIRQQIDSGSQGVYESLGLRKDGTRFPVEIRVRNSAYEGRQVRILAIQDITERKRAEKLQKALVEGTASATGPEFFHKFAKTLAQVFQSRYILVCEHLDFPVTRVKTLAFWMQDHLAENIEYDMAGGPCGETAMGEMTFYPEGLQELFPKDKDLVELNADSYCGFPLYDSSGHIIGHLAIMDDKPMDRNLCDVPSLQIFVSRVATELERKRVEEELCQYEYIVSSSTDMLALVDKNFVYLAANDSYLKAFRLDFKALVGKSAAELFGKEKFEKIIKPAAMRCLSGERVNYQHWMEFPEYGSVFMDVSYYPYYDRDNKIKGFVVNGRDFTERKQANDSLNEMNMALSNAMPGISRLDTAGRYVEVNDYYANVLGYEPEELINGGWSPTIHPDDMPIAKQAYEKMCREGKCEFEARAVRKDGSLFHKSLLMVRIDASDGSMSGHHCFMRDITERKQAEEKIRRQQDKLAHISRLSTMGEMATGLAHEVNQPLAAITNYCHAGLQTLDRVRSAELEPVRELFEKLTEQSLRAGEIIRRLRGLVGKRTPVRAQTSIGEPIREVLRLLDSDLRRNEVQLVQDLEQNISDVVIDEVQIQQVLVNLIRNAMDAMGETEGQQHSLTVSTSPSEDDLVEVAIRDTGKGIPDQSADQVFDAFFSSKAEGMGMGLAISRSIIESHGGRIWMTPNTDQGVTFHFTLPIEKKGRLDERE